MDAYDIGLIPSAKRRDPELTGRTAAVPAVAPRAGGRAFRATAGDRVSVPDPVDLVRGEGATQAGSVPLLAQQGGDPAVGVPRGQDADPLDDRRIGPSHVVGAPGPRDLQLRARLGLPADGHPDRPIAAANGHILD